MIDSVEFEVCGGAGGRGAVSFRREKFVPRGGPDGGDGGRGGDVIVVADRHVVTLLSFSEGRVRGAREGNDGHSNRRRGAAGGELLLEVPVGSVVFAADSEGTASPLADLTEDGAAVVVARGGKGGLGNRRFATPTRQAPRFAQGGAGGERRRLRIEVKLLADVGLVGLPNAGKSTLLRAWSAAQPAVGAYPFTTLEPVLGVVELGDDSFVVADMPGLIEGARSGAGIGYEFLRHIERTRVLVYVLDMTREDPLADRALIDAELAAFGRGLPEKPQLLALNKIDDLDARAHIDLLTEDGNGRLPAEWGRTPWVAISALSGEGTRALARRALELLVDTRGVEGERPEPVIMRPPPRRARFSVGRAEDGVVVVEGSSAERWAQTLDVGNDEARQELHHRLRRMGIARALRREGVVTGDTVRIGTVELRWEQ